MPNALVNEMLCPRCRTVVKRQPNDTSFWCSCGRHWQAPHQEPEIDDSEEKIVVDVPQVEIPVKKKRRGRIAANYSTPYGNRKDYLHRNGLSEAELMLDEAGREYWLKDNFRTGKSEKIFVPQRFSDSFRP